MELRRYAMFIDSLYGEYVIVVKGDDIERAPKWGGFIKWIGNTRTGYGSSYKVVKQ